MSTVSSEGSGKKQRNPLLLLPLIVFLGLAALFFYRLGAGDPARIPSALIGRSGPATAFTPLPGLQRDGKMVHGLRGATIQGAVDVLNGTGYICMPNPDV